MISSEQRLTQDSADSELGDRMEGLAADFDALQAMDDDDTFAGPPDDTRRIDYLPTPAEIQSACLSIRQSWTRKEKNRRFVGEYVPDEQERLWQPPVIDTTYFRTAINRSGDGAQ